MTVGQITVFDSAYFDQDYFDTEYNSTFLSNSRTDVQNIIIEHGISATLIRQDETTESMGDVTDVSETEYNIFVNIQDIVKKDRQIHEMGLAIPGNSKAFFFHEYPATITGSTTLKVQTGDIIQDTDGKQWRVEQILGERKMEACEIFRAAVIKKIDLDQ